jgi:hypothetical protein
MIAAPSRTTFDRTPVAAAVHAAASGFRRNDGGANRRDNGPARTRGMLQASIAEMMI